MSPAHRPVVHHSRRISQVPVTGLVRVDGAALESGSGERILRCHIEGATPYVYSDGQWGPNSDARFVFSGGVQGFHSISAGGAVTTPERLLAHWNGYVASNTAEISSRAAVVGSRRAAVRS